MDIQTSAATRKMGIWSSFTALTAVGLVLIAVPAALRNIASSNFLPHAMCYMYNKQLIALHLGCDAAIWLAYLSISLTLVYLVWKTRREIPFSWMFLAFGTFIVACGFTHFMEMVVLWKPLYWLSADVKLVTAFASVVTAVALPGLVPQVHKMVAAASISEDRRVQLERANAELQHVSSRVMVAQDEERRRIARELHDGVGQYLAAIKMSCDVAQEQIKEQGNVALQDAISLIERCTSEVRTMSHLLHPPLLEEIGLASAVPWYVQGFIERSGIKVQLDLPASMERLPEAVEIALFRVLQEALTNIHRHSGSKTATVRLHSDAKKVWLEIEDRGKGFNGLGDLGFKSGVGIASMRERVRELGGEFQIQSNAIGTTIRAVLPLAKENECQKEFSL